MRSIYLDYAAATPMDERVLAAMMPYFGERFYNPSSPYLAARAVKADIEAARSRVAQWLGAKPAEIIFTAGATESVNLAIHGVMRRFPGATMLAAATEHDSVLASAGQYSSASIPVLPDGSLDLERLSALLDDTTVLVSVAYANNEVGTIQPLKDIARILDTVRDQRRKQGNELPLYLHTDASQAGYLDLHADRLGVDLMTLGGGKIYGPKQSGILFVKAGIRLKPLIVGGGQEADLRSGTENVASVIGFATALELIQSERKTIAARLAGLRDDLQAKLLAALPHTQVNGHPKRRLPAILHLSWPNLDGERLVMLLDEHGVQAATGAACAANKHTGSHVLEAIDLDEAYRQGSLRLSLGMPTAAGDIEQAAAIIIDSVNSFY